MNQDVVVNFIARNASFMGATKQMASAVSGLERQLTKLYKAAVGFGVGTVAAYYAASRSAITFERNLRNVNSILGANERRLGMLADQMLQLSTEIPKSAADLSAGLYQVVSSGFTNAADSAMVLEEAAKASVAGLTDTATAANAVTTVLNAYGLSAADAAHVSDVLFQTVNVGVVNFEQLAINIGDFIGTARAAGATMEETFAAFSNISIAMGNPARSATALQGIFRALIKPSEDMTEVLNQLGYANGQVALQSKGLDGILRELSSAVKGDSTAMAKLFQDTEGFQGVLALLSQDAVESAQRISLFTDEAKVAGVTARVMAEQEKSVGVQMDQLKSSIGAVTITFGQVMLPVMSAVAKTLAFLAGLFVDLPAPIKTVIAAGGLLTGVLTGLAGVWLLVSAKVKLFQFAMKGAELVTKSFAGETVKQAGMSLTGFVAKTNLGAAAMVKFGAAAGRAKTAVIGLAKAAPAAVMGFMMIDMAAQHFADKHYEDRISDLRNEIELFAETQSLNDLTKSFEDLDKAAKVIDLNFDTSAMDEIKRFSISGPGKTSVEFARIARDVRELDKALADMVSAGNAEAASKTYATLRRKLEEAGASSGALDDAFSGYLAALSDTDQSQKAAAQSAFDVANAEAILDGVLGGTSSATAELDKLMKNLTSTQKELVSSLASGAGGFQDIISNIVGSQKEVAKEEKRQAKGKSPEERALDYAQALMGVERANRRVAQAQKELNEARNKNYDQEILDAEEAIRDSYDATRKAEKNLIQAQKDLDEVRKNPEVRDLEEAEFALRRALMRQEESVKEVKDAHEQLAEAQDHGTPDELAESERRLDEALMSQKEAGWAVLDAEKALRDLREQPNKAEEIAEAEEKVADAVESVSDAKEAALKSEKNLADLRVQQENIPNDVAEAEINLEEAVLGVRQAVLDLAKSQEEESTQASDTFDSNIARNKVSLGEFMTELSRSVSAHENWQRNISTIYEKYGAATAGALAKLGTEGADLVDQLANASGADAERMGKDLEKWALYGTEAFNAAIVTNLGKGVENAKIFSQQTAKALAEELGIGIQAAIELLQKYGYAVEGYASAQLVESSPGTFRFRMPNGNLAPNFQVQAEGTEDHRAQIAPAGAWRVWAEPETGGEAYIPLSPAKRGRSLDILQSVAERFGFGLSKYADGGLAAPTARDFVYAGVTNPAIVNLSVQGARAAGRYAVPVPGTAPGGGNIIAVGRAIQKMGFHVSEHPAFGGVGGGHAATGYHYLGRAIDVNWRGAGQEAPHLDMLYSWIRNNVNPITELLWKTKDHFDHLHLAMLNGGILEPKKFDSGGYLDPGFTLAYNGTGKRETVHTAGGQGPGGVTFSRGAIQVEVRAEAGVDQGRLATLVGEKVEIGVRTAVDSIKREIRSN